MWFFEHPVLQRELLVNLRTSRSFLLLLLYQVLLGAVVLFAWPRETRLDMTQADGPGKQLFQLFFLGQYMIASLMVPSFAAGALTLEKEKHTYEMLLASPLWPSSIVFGKLLAAVTHLAILIFTSLPIVMLCQSLGGVHYTEVLVAYLGLLLSVLTFGMISVACSSYFQRTASSLVVSYLLILPLALLGIFLWQMLSTAGEFRLVVTAILLPTVSAIIVGILFFTTSQRLMHPPDVGSEGKEVIDIEQEAAQAVGLVIQSDQFPDMLFAPAKRDDLMEDGANPVYDKEVRSEIFSQGTLMLRLVIQVSMLVAIPLMAVCLFMFPQYAYWFIRYVLMFNMLVGPVFSAGTITSERERQTLDLLLTTIITPWQILWGKLVAGLRVSTVLTLFLVWPVVLAALMVQPYWNNFGAIVAYLGIVLLSCVVTAMIALFCSVVCHKTSSSMISAYMTIVLLWCGPLAAQFFAQNFFPETEAARYIEWTTVASPFAAAFDVPLSIDLGGELTGKTPTGDWFKVAAYFGFTLLLITLLFAAILWFFEARWRVAEGGEGDDE